MNRVGHSCHPIGGQWRAAFLLTAGLCVEAGYGSVGQVVAADGPLSVRTNGILATNRSQFIPSSGAAERNNLVLRTVAALSLTILQPQHVPKPAPSPVAATQSEFLTVKLGLKDVDLAELIKRLEIHLPMAIGGLLTFDVEAAIPVNNPRDLALYKARGTASMRYLTLDGQRFEDVRARVDFDQAVLSLTELSAKVPDPVKPGLLQGTAKLGIAPGGDLSANLKLERVPVGPLLKLFPGVPTEMGAGKADGSIDIHAATADLRDLTKWTGTGRLTLDTLKVGNFPAEEVKADITLQGGQAKYSVTGKALGGTVDVSGEWPGRPGPQGKVQGRNLNLGALARSLGGFRGRLTEVTFDYGTDVAGRLTGTGRFIMNRLGYERNVLVNDLRGDLKLVGDDLRASGISAEIAGGRLTGRANLNVRRRTGFLNITLDGADGERLTEGLTSIKPVVGSVDIHLRARFDRVLAGSGEVMIAQGKLLGIEVIDARFPLDYALATDGRGEMNLRGASGQLSRGRLTGQATLTLGDERILTGSAQFADVDLRQFLNQYVDTPITGGRASGRVTFGGRGLKQPEDYTASVEARLTQATAFQLPVLRQIAPLVLPGQSPNVPFQSGEFRGSLAAGVFRVQRFGLTGTTARVFVDGTVTLSERLNLDVVARTNQLGIDPVLLRLVGLATLPAGPISFVTINRVSNYLSNRTVRVHLAGTVRSPSVQVNIAALFAEEAVRFFIEQANLPIPESFLP